VNIWGFVTIIALDFIVASYAAQKGKSKGVWFVISLLISPILAWIVLFFLKSSGNSEASGGKHAWGHAAAATVAILVGGYLTLQLPVGRDDAAARVAVVPSSAIAGPTPAVASGMTAQQSNAVRSAKQYLSVQGFSRKGLIEQLSSDAGSGYEVVDATVAVDSLDVDWNQQAVRSAKQYLNVQGFSCKGLVEQLASSAGSGFTADQAKYGAKQAGAC
jgi:energy-converting hydrogenase Eha subunit A